MARSNGRPIVLIRYRRMSAHSGELPGVNGCSTRVHKRKTMRQKPTSRMGFPTKLKGRSMRWYDLRNRSIYRTYLRTWGATPKKQETHTSEAGLETNNAKAEEAEEAAEAAEAKPDLTGNGDSLLISCARRRKMLKGLIMHAIESLLQK